MMSLINSNLNIENVRVRACFDCHHYHRINCDNYKAIQLLHRFEQKHIGHRTQIVNLDELFYNPLTVSVFLEV